VKNAAADLLRDWKCLTWCFSLCCHDDATRLLAGVVARVHTLVPVDGASELDRAFGRSTGADGQDEIGVLVANHGLRVVWGIVGSSTDHGSRWAGDRLTSRVGCVVGHGWVDDNATLREWVALRAVRVAVDVGQIPEDAIT